MIKVLRPIYAHDKYFDPVADDATQQLWDIIFLPIFRILQMKTPGRINSLQDIKTALRTGRIYWQEGYFYGEFNSKVGLALRSLGASFNHTKKAYKLGINQIPMDLRTDLVIGKGMNKSKTESILKALDEAKGMKIIIGAGNAAVSIIDALNDQAIQTLKILPESLQIPMNLTEQQQKNITDDYKKNLHLYIEDWKQDQIERLREKTQANAALGYRADRLAKIVKSEFGVSKSKAKMIARQETSLFVSRYRQERYTTAGIRQYIWSTSHDERVRKDHRDLDHKIFSWDEPPVVDTATGRKANPGEDFGCRCLAMPMIRLGA
jgi:SPP1 gp7 family putative phage head morphogenesis protein